MSSGGDRGDTLVLRALIDGSPLPIVGLDRDGRVTVWNAAAERSFGWTEAEVIGLPNPLLEGPDWEAVGPRRQRLLAEEPIELQLRRKDGDRVAVRASLGPVRDEKGRNVGYVMFAEDLTAQRVLEEDARSADRRAADVLERVSDAIVAFDRELHFSYASAKASALIGRTADELVGKHYLDVFPEADGSPFHLAYERALAEQEPVVVESFFEPWDRWFENRAYPSPNGLAVFFTEVSERKRVELALVESERRFRTLVEASPDLVSVLDLEGRFLYASPSWQRLLEWEPEKLVGRHVMELIHPEDLANADAELAEAFAGERVVSSGVRLLHRSGHWVAVESRGGLIVDEDRQPTALVGVSHDLSSRERAEAELRRSTERLTALREVDRALLEAATLEEIAAAAVVRMSHLLSASRISVKLWDEKRDELVLLAAANDGERESQAAGRVPVSGLDVESLRRSVASVASDLQALPNHPTTGVVLAVGDPARIILPMRVAGGVIGSLNLLASELVPGFSETDIEIAREVADQLAVAIAQSVAEKELRELADELEQRVHERTAQAERATAEAEQANAAKTEFLSRMSHELRTPLNAILGFGQLLQLDDLAPEQEESVNHIVAAGRHLLQLISDLLDVSQIEAGALSLSFEPVEARAVLTEALELVRPLAGRDGIELPAAAPRTSSYVLADHQRLLQVVLNLLANAVKYNRPGGSVELRCRRRRDRVRITVSDTGPGIPGAELDRLFEPFERIGQASIEGTGLGLPLARNLVTAMGGTLSVRSVLGAGSAFTVDLAAARVAEPQAP